MKKEFVDYLIDIGVYSEVIIKRIEHFLYIFRNLDFQEIKDIFISEYRESSGQRNYLSLDFYTDDYALSVNSFLSEDDFTIDKIAKVLFTISYEVKNYNFDKASESSRLNIDCFSKYQENAYWFAKASGKNCDYLRDIMKKYFNKKFTD